MKDYYSILQISRTSSSKEVKVAYRNLSKKYHPDVNKAHNATLFFIEIKEAYEIIIDESRRVHYNQLLEFATKQQEPKINTVPVIVRFYCDNAEFSIGDVVTFTWEVYDADLIELRPFGKVSKSGSKKIKITEVSTNLLVELFCFNSVTKNYVFSQIILKKKQIQNSENYNQIYDSINERHLNDDTNKFEFYTKLINENPHIDARNFEKEHLFSLFGRISIKKYRFRVLLFTIIYLFAMIFFISDKLLDSLFCLIINGFYYTLLYIQAVKRFHDFNSKGTFAFISVFPIIAWFQAFYLIKKQGDNEINNFGLPNHFFKTQTKEDFKQQIGQKISSFSILTKVAIGTALFNIIMIFFFFIIPKQEIPIEVINVYGTEVKNGKSKQHNFYVETHEGEFQISDKISSLILLHKPQFIYLGKIPITNKVSYVRIKTNREEVTHYISIINFNSPIPILYFLFLLFEIYVVFVDKKMRFEEQYETILGFITIINMAYFLFFIL